MAKTIIFDLDGTLTDSAEGITNSVKLVMSHFNIPIPGMDVLRTFVGPPLHDMFVKHGVPEDRVEEAISVFRSRYTTIGKYENTPYPGVFDLLQKLKSHRYTLYVATSKPEPQAKDILQHFQLAPYFDCICGASLDRSRITKEEVLRYLLNMSSTPGETVMVGDTACRSRQGRRRDVHRRLGFHGSGGREGHPRKGLRRLPDQRRADGSDQSRLYGAALSARSPRRGDHRRRV